MPPTTLAFGPSKGKDSGEAGLQIAHNRGHKCTLTRELSSGPCSHTQTRVSHLTACLSQQQPLLLSPSALQACASPVWSWGTTGMSPPWPVSRGLPRMILCAFQKAFWLGGSRQRAGPGDQGWLAASCLSQDLTQSFFFQEPGQIRPPGLLPGAW